MSTSEADSQEKDSRENVQLIHIDNMNIYFVNKDTNKKPEKPSEPVQFNIYMEEDTEEESEISFVQCEPEMKVSKVGSQPKRQNYRPGPKSKRTTAMVNIKTPRAKSGASNSKNKLLLSQNNSNKQSSPQTSKRLKVTSPLRADQQVYSVVDCEIEVPKREIASSCVIDCRSVRIGSYKTRPFKSVMFNYQGIFMQVKPVSATCKHLASGDEGYVNIQIPAEEVLSCVANFGRTLPMVCISTTSTYGESIRGELNMTTYDSFYDPDNADETQKRIIFVAVTLDGLKEVVNKVCDHWAEMRNVSQFFTEIDQKAANEMLLLSTPAELINKFKKIPKPRKTPAPVQVPVSFPKS